MAALSENRCALYIAATIIEYMNYLVRLSVLSPLLQYWRRHRFTRLIYIYAYECLNHYFNIAVSN